MDSIGSAGKTELDSNELMFILLGREKLASGYCGSTSGLLFANEIAILDVRKKRISASKFKFGKVVKDISYFYNKISEYCFSRRTYEEQTL